MAEIEFKRRGTPLWAVLLVLLVVAGILYGVFARRGGQPAAAPADTVTTPTGPAPTAATPTTPAAPVSALAAYGAWADTAKMPSAPAAAGHYVATGLRALLPVLKERTPMAGVQHVMIGAMADTLDMPNVPEAKLAEATQAAFFAVSYATKGQPGNSGIENAAAALQLKTPLPAQKKAVEHFFKTTAQEWRAPVAKSASDSAATKAAKP